MSSSSLRNCLVRLGLQSMNHVGKLHSILDEEDWQIDTDDVQIACVSVEASCETSNISSSVSASALLVSSCGITLDV